MASLKKIMFIVGTAVFCLIILFLLIGAENANNKLMWNEIKAYFRPTVSLNFNPNTDDVARVQSAVRLQ